MFQIADRFEEACRAKNIDEPTRITTILTLEFAHEQCPLDMPRLLAFPDEDFMHDVLGLLQHVDRITKKLDPTFTPRCAASNFEPEKGE
jgi:hypothetical protein